MTSRKKLIGVLGFILGSTLLFAPMAYAQTVEIKPDPAHHSTDVNDPDPAHHRPYLVCPTSAGGGSCVLTPVEGFDLAGFPLENGNPGSDECPTITYDEAHHSTDTNDPDPAHHQPRLVCEDGVVTLEPIPGFDLDGYPI